MSSPRRIIESALNTPLSDEDGAPVNLQPLPGLVASQIAEFERHLRRPLPAEIRELLEFTAGFDTEPLETIRFAGIGQFEMEEIFPDRLDIAHDGYGNYWVVDLHAGSPEWGPVYFCCHDAPVILVQSSNLAEFLEEAIKMLVPPHKSLIDAVHEDRLFKVWRTNPGVIPAQAAAQSPDPEIRAFAETLDHSFDVIDLRNAPAGMGFSWGRFGPRTKLRRFGKLPIFACGKPERKSFFGRLLGRRA